MTTTLLYVLLAVSTNAATTSYLEIKTFESAEACERIELQLNGLSIPTRYRCETEVVPGSRPLRED